jgi:hypothetical protein
MRVGLGPTEICPNFKPNSHDANYPICRTIEFTSTLANVFQRPCVEAASFVAPFSVCICHRLIAGRCDVSVNSSKLLLWSLEPVIPGSSGLGSDPSCSVQPIGSLLKPAVVSAPLHMRARGYNRMRAVSRFRPKELSPLLGHFTPVTRRFVAGFGPVVPGAAPRVAVGTQVAPHPPHTLSRTRDCTLTEVAFAP